MARYKATISNLLSLFGVHSMVVWSDGADEYGTGVVELELTLKRFSNWEEMIYIDRREKRFYTLYIRVYTCKHMVGTKVLFRRIH